MFDKLYETLYYSATELNEIKILSITRSNNVLYSAVIASIIFELSSTVSSNGGI